MQRIIMTHEEYLAKMQSRGVEIALTDELDSIWSILSAV